MSRRKCFGMYTVLFTALFFAVFFAFFSEGKSFVWKSDGMRQYFPALRYLGSYYREILSNLAHGNFTLPMIDYTVGQGEDILTTFANYGLGDPLTLLSIFVKGEAASEFLYGFLVFLRLYLAGAAFLIFGDGMKLERQHLIFGGLVYAFCGFALWSVKDPFFLNGLIYLPLILLGIEWVRKDKTPFLLLFSVFFCASSSYYFFYMSVIAGMCYFFARECMAGRPAVRGMVRRGAKCMAVSLVGVCLSGSIFIPCIYGFMESSRGEVQTNAASLICYNIEYYRNLFLRLAAVAENDDAGAVAFFSMAAAVLAAAVLLIWKKGKTMKALKWCVLLSLAAVASPLAGFAFNGFRYVTNRFMFIPSFLLSLVLVMMMPSLFSLEAGEKKRLALICGGYALVCVLLTRRAGIWQSACMVFFLMSTVAVLCLVRDGRRKKGLVYGLLLLNLAVNGNLLYTKWGVNMADAYLDAGEVAGQYRNEAVLAAAGRAGTLGRVDDMVDGGENPNRPVAGYGGGYYGVSVYYSVVSSGYSDLMKSMENAPDLMYTHRLLGNDGRTLLEQLSNVRYVVSGHAEAVPYGYEKEESTDGAGTVYKNRLSTSVGYTYDKYVAGAEYDTADLFARQETLSQAAVLEDGSELLEDVRSHALEKGTVTGTWQSLPFEIREAKSFQWKSGKAKVTRKNGPFTVSYETRPGYEYYFCLKGLRLTDGSRNTAWAHVKVGGMTKSFLISNPGYDFYFGRENYAVNLGSLPEGSEAVTERMTFRINGPATYQLEDIELAEVPAAQLLEGVSELNRESLQEVKTSGNGLSGRLSLAKEKILCLAVPYKQGYTLYVDGNKAVTGRVNKMYIGARVGAGDHEIRLVYRTPGIVPGGVCTLIGVACLVGMLVGRRFYGRF